MNKLRKTQFARPLVRDARVSADIVRLRRRARPALVCVWSTDPVTGAVVCSWTEPTDGDRCRTVAALPIAA